MRAVGFGRACASVGLGVFLVVAGGCSSGGESTSLAASPTTTSIVRAVSGFVIPESASLSLIDVQVAEPSEPGILAGWTFSPKESPDDDGQPREAVVVFDASAPRFDDLRASATEIDVAGRAFWRSSEGENQQTFVGPTASGATIGVITLNVEEAVAVALLGTAEWSDGQVSFSGEQVPVGWVATGNIRSVLQFLAGATGSSTPIGGTRSLYADPAAPIPSWENVGGGSIGVFPPVPVQGHDGSSNVVFSAWPVQGQDALSEARHSMDGEIEVEVRRADGTSTIGFASPGDSEFFEFVVWQDSASWLALSRQVTGDRTELLDLAATVRPASEEERVRLDELATD